VIGQRHEVPRLQSDFYKDCYYKILNWLLASIAIMLVLIAAIIYYAFFQPKSGYYATTTTGSVIPLTVVHVKK
jgi:hypothetical protein